MPGRQPGGRVDEQSNGDEKQRDEGVAQRQSLLFKFVNEVGVANKQTGEKCSQSQGETYELGNGGDTRQMVSAGSSEISSL